jgi:hypothetical protein
MSNKLTVVIEGKEYTMYEPSEAQMAVHTSQVTNLIAIGNRGGGKSHCLRMDAHMRALSVPDSKLILVRQTYPQLLSSHLNYIHKEMSLLGGKFTEGKKCAYYPNGSKLFFRHVGNEADSLDQLSAEYLAAYFDELSTIPWDYFMKIKASVRVPPGRNLKGVIRAATNPLGPSAEMIRQYFVDKDVDPNEDPDYLPDEWGHVRISMIDNLFIDQAQYVKQFAGMPAYVKKAWLDGEFALENQLFDFYPSKEFIEEDEDGNQKTVRRPYHVINQPPSFKGTPVFSLY